MTRILMYAVIDEHHKVVATFPEHSEALRQAQQELVIKGVDDWWQPIAKPIKRKVVRLESAVM